VRFLAVFLETDILNCSIAALVMLDMSKDRLDAILSTKPRSDYEFHRWEFVKWGRLAHELLHPNRKLHPTSGLRMLLAGIVHFGVRAFDLQLQRAMFGRQRSPGAPIMFGIEARR
jgi:hypothetical protein